jgi:hypothetical protein
MLLESGFKKPEEEPALQHGQCGCRIGVFEPPQAKIMQLLSGPSSSERVFLEGDYSVLLGFVMIEVEPGSFRGGVLDFCKLGMVNQMFHRVVV